MDVPAIRFILADGSFVDCSIAIPLYIKLYGNLQSHSSGVSKLVHIGCCVLCLVLSNLASGVVLSLAWLHIINLRIEYNTYFLSLDCGYKTIHILDTE